jgi:hypothetical protein
MKRLAVTLLAFAVLLTGAPVVADAGPTKSISYSLKGSATWNAITLPSLFTISGDVMDGKRVVGSYTGTVPLTAFGPCAEPNNPYGPVCASPTGGGITFALHGGSLTTAISSGTVWQALGSASHEEYVFELALTVTGGTHAYRSATGTLSLHYDSVRDNFFPDPVTHDTCVSVDVLTCPILDFGALTGTIVR